jgi:hypothetical protein
MAGISLGLLTYKPHFGLLFPLFLLLERRWTTIASAGLTALAVAGAAALAFGPGAWEGFIASLTGVTDNALLARGAEAYKLQSFYGLFYRLTGDNGLALTAHAGLAAGILAALLWLWRRPGSPALKASALLAAAFLMTPYAYTYDTPVLVVAVAFLARDGMERGFRPWDKWLLLACLFLPGLFSTLGSLAAPSACLLLLGLAFRRTLPAGMKPTGAMVQPALGSAGSVRLPPPLRGGGSGWG